MILLEDLRLGKTPKEQSVSSRVEEPESGAYLYMENSQHDTGGHSSRERN